jgi:hypothetical protein
MMPVEPILLPIFSGKQFRPNGHLYLIINF